MRVAHNQTLPSAERWMKCAPKHPEREDSGDGDDEDYYGDENEATNEAAPGERPTNRSPLVASAAAASSGRRSAVAWSTVTRACRWTGSVTMAVLTMVLLS